MYFTVIEAIPKKKTEANLKYGGAHIACWINEENWDNARNKAQNLILSHGWQIENVLEERNISEESYTLGENGIEYFKQALIDNEVCVFYTFPKK